MRARPKLDSNHHEIADYATAMGASVRSVASVGDGFVDLVIGYRGLNLLWEVKDGTLIPSKRRLTEDEKKFHDGWRGWAEVISSIEDADKSLRRARTMAAVLLAVYKRDEAQP